MASVSSRTPYKVFISHAGEDKTTIAFPLREKLLHHGITAFVDKKDMPGGTWSEQAMITAMETADIAVVVLSPEFVARKWPVKELLCFLRRCQKRRADGSTLPVIIPLFYRLSIKQLYEEPKFDRRDENGKSLYRASRFFERMDIGEPEANVDNIQTALRKLHGAMGVENYVEASNDNTDTMLERRNVLLDDLCEHVRNAVTRLCEETTPTAPGSEREETHFRSYYQRDRNISDLVLKFRERDDDGNPITVEGRVLQAVLDRSGSSSVISIQGIGGVGKTSILRGISRVDEVNQRYPDGTHLLSLGAETTRNRLIEGLCKMIEDSGGANKAKEIRQEEDWKKVMKCFVSWFANKKCLFMVDDVWEAAEITSHVVHELTELHSSGVNSKVLFTTRSTEIASRAEKCFVLEPREPHGRQCRAILMLHSRTKVDESSAEDKRAITGILDRCAGLPLFLKLAGRAVRALSVRPGSKACIAYRLYSRTLDISLQGLLNTEVDSYERLVSSLSVSLRLLEDRKNRWGFPVHLSALEMQRRLSVLAKQSRVPMSMLRYLWELGGEAEACIVAREFEQIALATVYVETVPSGEIELLGLHDSLHEYATGETRRLGEEKLGHQILLEGYGQGLEKEEDCRAWWSTQLEVDGYAQRHICRHLASAGFTDELVSLLLKPEWTIQSFKVCGILDVERDYGLGISLPTKGGTADQTLRDRTNRACEIETALQMISEATRLSCGYNIEEPRELCFQLYGRLKMCAEENVVIKKYLNRLKEKAKQLWGPWLRPISSFLTPPGGATTRIVPIGLHVKCMIMTGDWRFAYCRCWDHRLVVVDVRSAAIVTEYISEPDKFSIACIALSRSEKLLYSFSSKNLRAGVVDVWDTKTGKPLRSFYAVSKICEAAHDDEKLYISKAVMGDGRVFLTFENTSEVEVWDLATEQQQPEPSIFHVGHHVTCIAVLPGGEYVVSGGGDKMLRIWKAASGEQQGDAFVGHEAEISSVSATSDGLHLMSESRDQTVRIWNIEKRTQVGKWFKGQDYRIGCVAISRDCRRVAYGYHDGTILVRDVTAGGEACKELVGHTGEVTGVAFHPVDDAIISCSYDETVRFWDLNKKSAELSSDRRDRHELSVLSIAFTWDGRYAVSGSQDCSLRVWHAGSGRQVGNPLLGHYGHVTGVAVTPDDERIVSASWDQTVRVWDFQSRKLLQILTHTTLIDSVAVTPSGGQAVTRSRDMTVQVWDLTEGHDGHFVPPRSYEYDVESERVGRLPRNNYVFLSDDGFRVVVVFESEISVWILETRQLVKTVKVENRSPEWLSRKEIMDLVGETYLESNVAFDTKNGKNGNEIWFVIEGKRRLLGILESLITCCLLSPEKETLCVGQEDGRVIFMKVEL